ncbi:hypothetical protein ACFPZI_34270 [Streptomyces chlorus]|uniref:Transposase n=1 Tax=Streptomyces chlorus TaxID=887452 RepID=A0ABW1E795_9ACTN
MSVQTATRVLSVSESGYYARRSRPPSPRFLRHAWLPGAITTIHTASHGSLLNRRRRRTRPGLANAIFEYLEIFRNRQRRHSALGMPTPVESEPRTTPSIAWSPAA